MITVITVTYNAAKELPATLESLARQSFQEFEHIIIDGASADDTLAIARRLSPRARIVSEPDNGLYFAMNKGLDMVTGDYVIFMNAGDAFHDETSLRAYADAAAGGADIIYGDTVVVDADRRFLRPRHLAVPEVLTKDSFSHGMLICHQAFMCKRKLAPKFDTSWRFSADYDWTLRVIERSRPGSCVNLHRVVVDFLDAGTTTQNHRASLRERFDIMRIHFGTAKTLWRHLSFIPRIIARKISGN
ncbi:MAG: glycosyltransferase [Muribaculaceae bacterium]|nr:glycosyltransferase [Muribaculaceae bacterium]